jgi:hypothetical protein
MILSYKCHDCGDRLDYSYVFESNQQTHPRSPSLFLKRGGEEDFLLHFSSQEKVRIAMLRLGEASSDATPQRRGLGDEFKSTAFT